jgi:hypothetical protein
MASENIVTYNVLDFGNSETIPLLGEVQELKKELGELKQLLKDIAGIQSPLLGIEAVALYFGKSQDTIRRWVKDRILSCYKLPVKNGYTYLFSMKQIEEDLEDYLVQRY